MTENKRKIYDIDAMINKGQGHQPSAPKLPTAAHAQLGLGGQAPADNPEIKMMSPEQIQESGLLQEINRLLLHPLGLSMVIMQNDATGEKVLAGIWDKRDDPNGFVFPDEIVSSPAFWLKATNVRRMIRSDRESKHGFVVQPLPERSDPDMS